MKELRAAFRLVGTALGICAWLVVTLWLGGVALWRTTLLLARWRDVFAEVRPCPRGHPTPMYGVYECRCGALHEGWIFARCRVCGQSAGWTPCSTCGLPIRSPFRV